MNPTYARLIYVTVQSFYSYMFWRNFAIFKESIYQYLKLIKVYSTVIICIIS